MWSNSWIEKLLDGFVGYVPSPPLNELLGVGRIRNASDSGSLNENSVMKMILDLFFLCAVRYSAEFDDELRQQLFPVCLRISSH